MAIENEAGAWTRGSGGVLAGAGDFQATERLAVGALGGGDTLAGEVAIPLSGRRAGATESGRTLAACGDDDEGETWSCFAHA